MLSTEMWRIAERLRWLDEEDEPDALPEFEPDAAFCEVKGEEEEPVRRLGEPRFGGRSRESVT